jgi:O-acetyl-ADP-ribose deacetylase (regulator of RNase III)
MAIHEVTGDILLSRAAVIAHGVAPDDHFGQGLALALRERWPALAKDFRHYCHGERPKAGELFAWTGPGGQGGTVHIVNLMTQEPSPHQAGHPGKATLGHVEHALKALAKLVRREGHASLALPRLATGVGGLAWEDVRGLMQQHLGDLGIPVFVYARYQPNLAADEAL